MSEIKRDEETNSNRWLTGEFISNSMLSLIAVVVVVDF